MASPLLVYASVKLGEAKHYLIEARNHICSPALIPTSERNPFPRGKTPARQGSRADMLPLGVLAAVVLGESMPVAPLVHTHVRRGQALIGSIPVLRFRERD